MHRKILQKGIGSWAQKGNSRYSGTCGCRKDHTGRSNFISDRYTAATGQSGPSGCLSGYGRDGAGPGYYDFSKQAKFVLGDFDVTLLDTPGHVDFLQRWSGPCRCWIMRCWSSAARTGCRDMWRHFGGCFPVIRSPPFCLSTRWTRKGQMRQSFFCSCKTAERALYQSVQYAAAARQRRYSTRHQAFWHRYRRSVRHARKRFGQPAAM